MVVFQSALPGSTSRLLRQGPRLEGCREQNAALPCIERRGGDLVLWGSLLQIKIDLRRVRLNEPAQRSVSWDVMGSSG